MRQLRRFVESWRGKYDVLAHADRYEHPKDTSVEWYSLAPDDIYPATISRIVDCIDRGERFPDELIDRDSIEPDGVAAALMIEAQAVAPPAWDWALRPLSEWADPESTKALEWHRAERAKALECARRWFTQALHVKVGKPVGIKILKDERYRL